MTSAHPMSIMISHQRCLLAGTNDVATNCCETEKAKSLQIICLSIFIECCQPTLSRAQVVEVCIHLRRRYEGVLACRAWASMPTFPRSVLYYNDITNISSDREAIRPYGLETCEYMSLSSPPRVCIHASHFIVQKVQHSHCLLCVSSTHLTVIST